MRNTSASSTTQEGLSGNTTGIFRFSQEAVGALPCRMLSSDRHLFPADAKGNLDTLLSPHNKIRFHSMLKPFGSCMLHPLQSVRAHGDRALRTCQWPLFGSPGFLPGPSPTETDIITVSLYLFLAAVQAPSHQLVLYASSSSLPDSGAIQDPE